MKELTRKQTTIRVSFVSIGGNLILCMLKLFAGLLGRSGALVSDAVHSAADAIDTIIVIVGIKLASKAPDLRHPYGHERMECVAALILSIVLGIIGTGIGYTGLEKIWSGQYESAGIPSRLALWAAIVSIIIKEGLYWYMRNSAKRINSESLMAIAWHNRADSLSSISSLIGIAGARAGFPVLDPLVSVIICLFVIKAALTVFKGAIDKMVDRVCSPETSEKIQNAVSHYDSTLSVVRLRTRLFSDKVYAELWIRLPKNMPLERSHEICLCLKKQIEDAVDEVKECLIIAVPDSFNANTDAKK